MNPNMMGGVNAVGGPVGGMPMPNNPRAAPPAPRSASQDNTLEHLHTYIYDHFLRNGQWDVARAIIKSGLTLQLNPKASPSRRNGENAGVNGVDGGSGDADSKDDFDSKKPDDLPTAKMPSGHRDTSFLGDWWALFMEIFKAQRSGDTSTEAYQYVQQTQNQQRMRQEQQQQLLRMNMNPAQMQQFTTYQNIMRIQQQKGMQDAQNLQRQAVTANRGIGAPNQLQQKALLQMRRDGSDVDINGQPRPQSPASAENAPSPSKRPRLEGAQMNGDGMRPNGMGQQMNGNMIGNAANVANAVRAHQMLGQHNISSSQLHPGQFNQFQATPQQLQRNTIQMMNDKMYPNQPGARQGPNGEPLQMIGNDFYQQGMRNQMGQVNQAGGNHALQDYQMQLILLEQQNKKRLQIARAEQAGGGEMRPDQPGAGPPGGPQGGPPGQFNTAGHSPPGSRNGNSPNPSEQMKRGTPKMNQPGIPGSPLGDSSMPQNRDSPSGSSIMFNGAGGDQANMMFYQQQMKDGNMVGPNGAVMRPPSSHPPNFQGGGVPMTQETLARMRATAQMQQGQNWQQQQQNMGGQQMMQNPSQGGQPTQPQQIGTPRQNNNMPPPQAVPAANATNTNRTQTSSPQSTAAPATPQTANKAAPKTAKKAAAKKKTGKASTATTGATPSSESAEPPTPTTTAAPITPMHASLFNGKANGPTPAGANGQAATAPVAPAAVPAPPPPQQPDATMTGYDAMADPSQQQNNFDLQFAPLDGEDVFNGLDFDSFLTDDAGGNTFNFDAGAMPFDGGVEAGTGDM